MCVESERMVKAEVKQVRNAECEMRSEQRRISRRMTVVALCALLFPAVRATADDLFLGRSLDQWNELLVSSEGSRRAYAAWGIAQLAAKAAGGPADPIAFSELVKLTSDIDPAVRCWGVSGLASFAERLGAKDGGRTAALNALEPLLEDSSAAPRIAAAESIGLLGQPQKGLPVLIAALDDRQESIRIQAAWALEKLGPAARPAEQALRKATADTSETVKTIARRSIAKLESKKKRP